MKQAIIRPSLLAVRKLIPTFSNRNFVLAVRFPSLSSILVSNKKHQQKGRKKNPQNPISSKTFGGVMQWWLSGCTQAFIQTHRHGTNERLHPAPSGKMLQVTPPPQPENERVPWKGIMFFSKVHLPIINFHENIHRKCWLSNPDLILMLFSYFFKNRFEF